MQLREQDISIAGPGPGQHIRAVIIRPAGEDAWPGVISYSDIFQLTASTLRAARRIASYGFVVCAPEIYPHGDLAGVALDFDDEGKRRGQAAADATSTADFDADIAAVLDHLDRRDDVTSLSVVGYCTGGHLAFRAALDPRVRATACFYPTGLPDGRLGADRADSLARASDIAGRLFLVFGSLDPHTSADARLTVLTELTRQGVDAEWHVLPAEHAFMRDEGPRYDPVATDTALAAAINFLSRTGAARQRTGTAAGSPPARTP